MRLKTFVAAAAATACLLGAAPSAHAADPRPFDGRHGRAPLTAEGADRADAGVNAAAAGQVIRSAGANRVETAAAISQNMWSADQAGAVVLSRADTFADSLAAAPLGVVAGAPLLLSGTASLPAASSREIDRVLPAGGTVYLLGGPGALAPAIESGLKSRGYDVRRLEGANRYATAVKVAEEVERLIGGPATYAAVTTGLNFPDGLAAGAGSGAWGEPVLLTADSAVPAETQAFIDARPGIELEAVGGPAAAAALTYVSVSAGADRYETAALVAERYFGHAENEVWFGSTVGVATGNSWPDALAAGPALGLMGGPLLLSRTTALPASTLSAIDMLETRRLDADVDLGLVFGGTAVLNGNVEAQLAQAIAQ